jgi:hypothetical protein
VKISDAFPGQYLKTSDLKGQRVVVTIDRIEIKDLGRDEKKPVLYFKGKKRGLILNKTNANSIIDIMGTEETERWHGRQIVLFHSKTDFQGGRVDCIRVDPARNEKPAPPPPREESGDDFVASDDDVPF